MTAPRVHFAGPLVWLSGRSSYHVTAGAPVCAGTGYEMRTTRLPHAVDCGNCKRILRLAGLLGNERGEVGRSCTA